ncbi:polysaccharide deacetylase family protein [Marinoscillum sp.]|uniref:polysaccharide deacetylase family protein n=1 Tax=Marinoscillum sp. TaxID=2024838 RepID=UPI003BAA0B28
MTVITVHMLLALSILFSGPADAVATDSKEVVCFVYHRFDDDRFPSTNISLTDFEAHLQYLRDNNYQVLPFAKAIEYLQSDQPYRKTAVITIDDGYKSFYASGLPLLEKYGYPATLFINTKTVGGRDYMDWEALQDAAARQIEIGNHTHSHAYFLNMPESSRYKTFEDEIRLSQKIITEQLGSTPTSFAYPYGELDSKMEEIIRSAGFTAAAAQNSGVISSRSNFMRCPRFPMSESYAAIEKFSAKARMHALIIKEENPSSFMMSEDNRPELTLLFDKGELQTNQLQCFIQGSECQITVTEKGGEIILKLSATGKLTRRRTLYTVTVPDKNGQWHWHSHLWIDPSVR